MLKKCVNEAYEKLGYRNNKFITLEDLKRMIENPVEHINYLNRLGYSTSHIALLVGKTESWCGSVLRKKKPSAKTKRLIKICKDLLGY